MNYQMYIMYLAAGCAWYLFINEIKFALQPEKCLKYRQEMTDQLSIMPRAMIGPLIVIAVFIGIHGWPVSIIQCITGIDLFKFKDTPDETR